MAKQIGSTEILEQLGKQAEKIKIEVEVPMGIAEFLDHLGEVPSVQVPTMKQFAQEAIINYFQQMLDGMTYTIFDYAAIHKWYGVRDFPNKKDLHTTPTDLKLGP
jgi:hypothetical protein